MKTIRSRMLLFIAALASVAALVANPIHGPKGGKIVTTDAPHVEFFVEKDRTVVVSFYDKDLNPVTPMAQVANAIAEAKTGKVNLAFVVKGGALVSTAPLPDGDDYTVVLQLRASADAKPKNYRVQFRDEICGECKRAEYACACDGHGAEKKDEHNH